MIMQDFKPPLTIIIFIPLLDHWMDGPTTLFFSLTYSPNTLLLSAQCLSLRCMFPLVRFHFHFSLSLFTSLSNTLLLPAQCLSLRCGLPLVRFSNCLELPRVGYPTMQCYPATFLSSSEVSTNP